MANPYGDRRTQFPRRSFLGLFASTGAFGLWPRALRANEPTPAQRVLRVAHLTDVHVQPERRAPEGMAACLRHIQQLSDKPGLILTGGDHVMDCVRQPRDRTRVQWDLWKRIVVDENTIPVQSCIGNHDIWGWNKSKSGATGGEPDYGKKWACDVLGLGKTYYSFSRSGWHFIALDGVQPREIEGEFCGYLDDEQYDWLQRDLAGTPASRPILIWSHIPIISALATLINPERSLTQDISIEAGHVHADAAKILALLVRYPNVKACLSGHLHRVEHVEFKGIHFHCNGAVSAAWWRGKNDGFAEGYALVDLFADGSHHVQYVPFGWQAG